MVPILAALLLMSPVRSASAADTWEQLRDLPVDARLTVTLKTGQMIKARFKGLQPDALVVTDRRGRLSDVPRTDIRKVHVDDSLANGALVGAGIGLGASAAILGIAGKGEGHVLQSAKWGAPLLLSGIGALAGALIDRAHTRRRIVYEVP